MSLEIEKMEITYSQEDPFNSGNFEEIKVSVHNDGVGNYYQIKTDSWCIDNEKELSNLLKDFKKRLHRLEKV